MAVLICYRTRRRLGGYLDGALDEAEGRAAVIHLEGCARCRSEAEGLRRLRAALVSALRAPEPADWTGLWPAIVRGIQDARPEAAKPARARWRPRLAVGSALAAAALAALVLWPFGHDTTKPDAVVVSLAEAGSTDGTVMVYSPPEHDLAVVWVFDGDAANGR